MHSSLFTTPGAGATPPAHGVRKERVASESPLPPTRGQARLSSLALMGDAREVEIDHGGQIYRLRVTALGKLILTK